METGRRRRRPYRELMKLIDKSRFLSPYFLMLVMTAVARAAAPPATAPGDEWRVPKYPVPYAPPTAEEIKAVLDRVRDRLDNNTAARIVDSKTGEPIDPGVSEPNPNAAFEKMAGNVRFTPYNYPMGVAYSGSLLVHEVTGDAKYAEFPAKRFEMFAKNIPALAKWPKENERRNPLRSIFRPTNLDSCGAIGAAMIRAHRMKIGPEMREVYDRFADYILNKQFRLEDGTLARKGPFPKSLWLDDAYMSVPLLAQYAVLAGERKYFDDGAKQIKQFYKHLFVPEKGLFTHGGNMDNPDSHPRYCWGRSNGWFMVATVELLDLLPEDHADRAELIKILNAHAKGVASAQGGKGLWHQLLDRTDSYEETSCTSMFSYSMAKGVNRGWLNADAYAPVAIAGWNGITTQIGKDGEVNNVCIGTNYADDMIYYYHRPAMDDIHGYGPVLLAGAEMIRLMKNDKLDIKYGPTNPVMVSDKN